MTALGALHEGDCLDILPHLPPAIVDTVFADPPFNLGKAYGRRTNDSRADAEYLEWCKRWLGECIRVLKPGGALFVYHLPRWNILIGAHLMDRGMLFRNSVAIEMKSCLPIPGRLYPAHYSLLYFTNGKPKTFRRVRTPIETCRHCGGEIKDYGGHRGAMNPWASISRMFGPTFHRCDTGNSRARSAGLTRCQQKCSIVLLKLRPDQAILFVIPLVAQARPMRCASAARAIGSASSSIIASSLYDDCAMIALSIIATIMSWTRRFSSTAPGDRVDHL